MPSARKDTNRRKKLSGSMPGSFFVLGMALVGWSSPAEAWYDHTSLTPWIVRAIETEYFRDPNHPYSRLHAQGPRKPETYETMNEYRNLADLLLLNPQGKLKSVGARTVTELLTLSPDDPDHGMDHDLPDSADPQNERRFMGGHQAPSSQGFRHMYFAGFEWTKPLSTFQVPTHPIGQAIDRFNLLANEARARVRTGDVWWGLRIAGWALHYLQDLTQPFHTNQVPNLKMLPFSALLQWPPSAAWENLKRESTRTIENYHWAYEGYVRESLILKERSPFDRCLTGRSSTLLVSSPSELIEEVVRGSRSRSARMGSALMGVAGTHLKDPEFHLSRKKGTLDYAAMRTDPAREESRRELHEVTCESLALAKAGSLWLLKWIFHPGA
jgi:hypothetical protein